jgi:hypothetical protein
MAKANIKAAPVTRKAAKEVNPDSIPIEQQNAVRRARILEAYEARSDVEMQICEARELAASAATLAGEFDFQADDGPGERAKQRALIHAIEAIAKAIGAKLDPAQEALDSLNLYDEVKPATWRRSPKRRPRKERAMMDDKRKLAPGVTIQSCYWGFWIEGKRDAVLASHIVEEDWLSDCTKRRSNGNILRQKFIVTGGRVIETTVSARGRVIIQWWSAEQSTSFPGVATWSEKYRKTYDGNKRVAWSDCAWRPKKSGKRA